MYVVDDLPFSRTDRCPSNALTGRQPLPQQRLGNRAIDDSENQVVRIFVQEEQRTGLRVQNFDRLGNNEIQHGMYFQGRSDSLAHFIDCGKLL